MKIIGIGLNKTGTKTLRHCLKEWGYRHQSYDLAAFGLYRDGRIHELLTWMDHYDSFEDWPWPLIYREIDERFASAKFILTLRESPERWYRSLCQMAVRMGPLEDFEQHIYGYGMPHGHQQHHLDIYRRHEREVTEYFRDRPGKLLTLCWENGDTVEELAKFLGQTAPAAVPPQVNQSYPVYAGDNLILAQCHRVWFQTKWKWRKRLQRLNKKWHS